MSDLKPSHFTAQPFNSICNKSEHETVARNIMVIRKRRGDKWELSKKQYVSERKKDGGYSNAEGGMFDEVYHLIRDAIGAISFCPDWTEAARGVECKTES